MEVFMSNVPVDLSDRTLKDQLSPLLEALAIEDWSCAKTKKKKFGTITFLRQQDGQRFLRQHGQHEVPGARLPNGRPRHIARLNLLAQAVYCSPSQHDPDPFLLKSLVKAAEDRCRTVQHHSERPNDAKVVFSVQKLSCGYYGYANKEVVYSSELEWLAHDGYAKFGRDSLIINFNNENGTFRVEIPYGWIEQVVTSSRPTALTLTLLYPPRLFQIVVPNDLTTIMSSLRLQPSSQASQPSARTASRVRLTGLSSPNGTSEHNEVLGQSLVYRISVAPNEFYDKVDKLRQRNILPISNHNFSGTKLYQQSLADGMLSFIHVLQESATTIPFDVLFQFQALVQNGYLLPWTAKTVVLHLLRVCKRDKAAEWTGGRGDSSGKEVCPISADAVKKLFRQMPFPGPETDASAFTAQTIWEWLLDNEKELRQGVAEELITDRARANLTMVYKALVTPTGVYLKGPEPEAKNRILRRFPDHTGHFIRVQLADEGGQDFRFNSKISNDRVYQRFKSIFMRGFPIAGRVYSCLGWSHSSLRTHSAWCMAPFFYDSTLQSHLTIKEALGNFDDIFSPARCAARIGQAFSETPFAISLSKNSIKDYLIPDIKSKDERRVFTDGVGTISMDVAEIISEGMRQSKGGATCFQFRWAGVKGMLAVDSRLKGKAICVRPSMSKFPSKDTENLEICDVANKPISLVLNRQMIKIMEDMGVPDWWFFRLQDRELERLRLITAQTYNTVAFLKRQKIADQLGFAQMIRRLDRIGIDYKRDRFLCSVVEVTVLRELRLLKHKARIPVENGVTLFGICDETGFLEEGEIYITFDQGSPFVRGNSEALDQCEMIVTRSPALHPGDIQLATNRIPPWDHPLRVLRNCIVFSQKGSRDLPSQLSGGDLDGDIYGIIWDPDAVQLCKRVFPPADYPRVSPLDIGRKVELEDMIDFFIQFMQTDQLGLIATKHMILSDQRHAGTVDKDCMLLAQMHSTAVDYSKTGIPVDMSLLRQVRQNRYRPDFLAPAPPLNIKDRTEIDFDIAMAVLDDEDEEDDDSGPRHQYYRSDKLLGRLYRAIDEEMIWNDQVRIKKNEDEGANLWVELLVYLENQCNEKLGYVDWKRAVAEARNMRNAYDNAIWEASTEFAEHAKKPLLEVEVFTGNIINKAGVQTRRQRDTSVQLKDEYDRISRDFATAMRRGKATNTADGHDDDGDDDDFSTVDGNDIHSSKPSALELCLACLYVGCEGAEALTGAAGRQAEGDYQSFKVIAACCVFKELDLAIVREEIAAGAAVLGGGYVGVGSGRA